MKSPIITFHEQQQPIITTAAFGFDVALLFNKIVID